MIGLEHGLLPGNITQKIVNKIEANITWGFTEIRNEIQTNYFSLENVSHLWLPLSSISMPWQLKNGCFCFFLLDIFTILCLLKTVKNKLLYSHNNESAFAMMENCFLPKLWMWTGNLFGILFSNVSTKLINVTLWITWSEFLVAFVKDLTIKTIFHNLFIKVVKR